MRKRSKLARDLNPAGHFCPGIVVKYFWRNFFSFFGYPIHIKINKFYRINLWSKKEENFFLL